MKISERWKCPECGSVFQKIVKDEAGHKLLVRVCESGCTRDNEQLIDYGPKVQ